MEIKGIHEIYEATLRQASTVPEVELSTVQGVKVVCTSRAQNCIKGSDAARCLLPWAAFTGNNQT